MSLNVNPSAMDFVQRNPLLLTISTAVVAILFGLFLIGQTDPEPRAFREVCGDLAGRVVAGDATPFDYMATRCPARTLTNAQAAAEGGR